MAKTTGDKALTLTVSGTDFNFTVSRKAYNDYQNSLFNNKNKVGGANNFLLEVVDQGQRQELIEFIGSTPGCELELVAAIVENYAPDLELTVKKSTG